MLRAEFLLVRLPLSPLALTLSPMYSSVRRPQLVAAHRGTCSHFLWLWGHEYCKAWETAAEPGGLSMLISLCNTMPNNMSLVQTSHKMLVLLRQHGKHLNHRTASGQNGEMDRNSVPYFFNLTKARGTSVVPLLQHGLRSAVQLLKIISLGRR